MHDLFTQTHHLLPSWPPNLAKNDQFCGYSGPNNISKWLLTASEAFQSQNSFTIKDYEDWVENLTWHFKSITIFFAKMTPILAKNEQLKGWFIPNDMCKWLQIAAEALQSQNCFMSKVYTAWDGNHIWFLIKTHNLVPSQTPNLVKNGQFGGYFGPNNMCEWL